MPQHVQHCTRGSQAGSGAQQNDARIGAKILLLHFYDCFVKGCDGSILLDNDSANGVTSEKYACPNANSVMVFDVFDHIKTALGNECPDVVSCADILAIASQFLRLFPLFRLEVQHGKCSWEEETTGLQTETGLTAPFHLPLKTLDQITAKFSDIGLDSTDLVALSVLSHRLYNFSNAGNPDPSLDTAHLEKLQDACPQVGNGRTLTNPDPSTPDGFYNNYFTNIQNNQGLLQTDQDLFSTSGADTVAIVNRFANSQSDFFDSFGQSMIKMGNISPLTGKDGEIRTDCKRVN
ncbi:hypothetical protein SLEP1_g7719 [Rubroshorea leprosula]|uniref:Peroxidase n=1 Tax=Rubroshorea leprosula TaxID=152421 RepID=A0AAV5HZB7_9ROSI|nr:hypothetical protein SLEP1_g7719 [Rubroshorea leprosula]